MASRERRAGAVESWAAKYPRLARMSSQADIRAEGEKVTGARSPFRTLYGRSVAGLVVGVLIAFAAIRFVVGLWDRYGAWPFILAGLGLAAVVVSVRWWRNPLRGIRI